MMYDTLSFQWFLKSENPDMHSINSSHRGPIGHIIKIPFQITSSDHELYILTKKVMTLTFFENGPE